MIEDIENRIEKLEKSNKRFKNSFLIFLCACSVVGIAIYINERKYSEFKEKGKNWFKNRSNQLSEIQE